MKRGCPTSPSKARCRWVTQPYSNKVDPLETIAFEAFWKTHLDFRQRDLVRHMIENRQREILIEWNRPFLEEAKKLYDPTKICPYFVYDPNVLYIRFLDEHPQHVREVEIRFTAVNCVIQMFTKTGSDISFAKRAVYQTGCPCPDYFQKFVKSEDAHSVFELYWNTHPINPRSCSMDSNLKKQKTLN